MKTSGVHLWLVMMKAHEALREHAERHIHSLGIGFSDFAALEVLLHKGPTPVNELAADFEQSRPAISKHLRVLRASRLVTEEKVGRERLYALNPAPLAKAAGWLEGYRAFWQRNLTSLKRYLEES